MIVFNPFKTAIPFWGQTILNLSSLSPKRDCGPEMVKLSSDNIINFNNRGTLVICECVQKVGE